MKKKVLALWLCLTALTLCVTKEGLRMKRVTHSAEGAFRLLLTLVAAALILPSVDGLIRYPS